MNEQLEPDPLDALRAADPVDADRLSSASLARIRARVNEDVMTTRARRLPWGTRTLGLGAGVAAIAAFALVVALGGRSPAPGATPGGSVGTGSASCVEPYSKTAITHRTFAFDGTVSAINGEQVTFTVGKAYRGAAGGTITLDAPGMTGTAITSAGGPNLAVGERYLVAGDDHFVWACGYTQRYDAAVAAEWAAVLGG
jgi:hypothetical protein